MQYEQENDEGEDRLTDVLEIMRDASRSLINGSNNNININSKHTIPCSKRHKANDQVSQHIATARACGVSMGDDCIGGQSNLTTQLLQQFYTVTSELDGATGSEANAQAIGFEKQSNDPIQEPIDSDEGIFAEDSSESESATAVADQVKEYEERMLALKSIQSAISHRRHAKEATENAQVIQSEITTAEQEVALAKEELNIATQSARDFETKKNEFSSSSEIFFQTADAETSLVEALNDLKIADNTLELLKHAARTLISKYAAAGHPAGVALELLTQSRTAKDGNDERKKTLEEDENVEEDVDVDVDVDVDTAEWQLDDLKRLVAERCGFTEDDGGGNALPVIEAVYGLVADSLLSIDRPCPTDPTDARAVCMLAIAPEQH